MANIFKKFSLIVLPMPGLTQTVAAPQAGHKNNPKKNIYAYLKSIACGIAYGWILLLN